MGVSATYDLSFKDANIHDVMLLEMAQLRQIPAFQEIRDAHIDDYGEILEHSAWPRVLAEQFYMELFAIRMIRAGFFAAKKGREL
jgi:hypothetical protein